MRKEICSMIVEIVLPIVLILVFILLVTLAWHCRPLMKADEYLAYLDPDEWIEFWDLKAKVENAKSITLLPVDVRNAMQNLKNRGLILERPTEKEVADTMVPSLEFKIKTNNTRKRDDRKDFAPPKLLWSPI
ncbi:MAG: hypothetical protein RIT04_146 [Candidatus Parcubacteria bacterium]|jgi:hypothetical protein